MSTTELVPYHASMSTFEVAGHAMKLAEELSKTQFVPAEFRGKPHEIMACILMGHEVGITPLQALQKIDVIKGRPAMRAELMRALVFAAGHELWTEDSTSTRSVVCGRRKGSEQVWRMQFTMDDAKKAGLAGNPNYTKFGPAMLFARASSALCRAMCPDVLGGISYATEELNDGDLIDGPLTAPPESASGANGAPPRARARAAATRGASPAAAESKAAPSAAGPVPPLPGEDDDIVDAEVISDKTVDVDGPRLSGPQMIAMKFAEHGVSDRAVRLHATGELVGRQVESSKDLTPDETSFVLVFLDGLAEGEAIPAELLPAAADEPAAASFPVDGDGWKAAAKERGVTLVPLLKFCNSIAGEVGKSAPGSWGQISGSGFESRVWAWIKTGGAP